MNSILYLIKKIPKKNEEHIAKKKFEEKAFVHHKI